MVALWGVGLPRFVHVMTAHVPPRDASQQSFFSKLASLTTWTVESSGSSCGCSHHGCSFTSGKHHSRITDTDADSEAEHEDGERCPVCELLATLLTNVPALPALSHQWQPIRVLAVAPPERAACVQSFGPHSPRGPPHQA